MKKQISAPTNIASTSFNFNNNNDNNNTNSFEISLQQRLQYPHKANLPTLQDNNHYYASEYSIESNFLKQQPHIKTPTIFPLQSPLLSFNLMSKPNNTNNNSPDSGLKEMSFDSNISDIFNNNESTTSLDFSSLISIDSSKLTLNDDYKNSSNNKNNNNLNYLYNIKRKLNNLKNISKTEITNSQSPQQLNDLNKIKNNPLNKENFSIKHLPKQQLSPLKIQNYSSYMMNPSSASLQQPQVQTTSTSVNQTQPIVSSSITIKKSNPVYFSPTFKKNKSLSNSSIDNYSLSEGYDSLKQNDEDIVKLHLTKRYCRSTSITNSQDQENVNNEQQNSSNDDEEEERKVLKLN